jgi:hypothetical protein
MQEHGGDHVGHASATGVEQRQLLLQQQHQHLRQQQRAGGHQLRALREQRGHERPRSSRRLVPPATPRWSCLPRKAEAAAEEDDEDDDVDCCCHGLPRHGCSDAGCEAYVNL